jgi:hypothetical protein
MAARRSSSKNTSKINLKPILNKTSPRAHTESKLDVPKACEICNSLVQKKKLKKKEKSSSHRLPKLQLTSFWFQGILGFNGSLVFFISCIILSWNDCIYGLFAIIFYIIHGFH